MIDIQRFSSVEDALRKLFDAEIKSTDRVYGGDINNAFALELTNGERVFMKSNQTAGPGFFMAEALGLAAISASGTIRTPRVLGCGTDRGKAFLLLEYIAEGRPAPDFWETFGRQLAAMHRADTHDLAGDKTFGFRNDNYIGHTEQINTPCDGWIQFFRDYRLAPQFKMAERYFNASDQKRITRLLDRLDTLMVEPEHPSLLHGDLWSGNYMTDSSGKALLIDPAVYVGHAEADIAMTELFVGFNKKFYAAYREAAPMQPGYEDRRDLYNLYQLLNHLNMFGGSYLREVNRIVRRYT